MQELEVYDQLCAENEANSDNKEERLEEFENSHPNKDVLNENSGIFITTQSFQNDRLNNALVDIKDLSLNDSQNCTLNISLGKKASTNHILSESKSN